MFSPFAHYGIDERAARLVNASIGVLAASTTFLSPSLRFLALALLGLDVSARAFSRPHLSLLTNAARKLLWLLSIPSRRVDAAPKRFAARVGLVMVAVMVLADATGNLRILLVTSMLLSLTALLEASINFSAIWWAWTHMHRDEGGRTGSDRLRAG